MAECGKGCWVDPDTGVEFSISVSNMQRWRSIPYRTSSREPLAERCIHFLSMLDDDSDS